MNDLLLYIAILPILGLCFAFWRQAVYAIFVVLFVEGFLRNYLNTPYILLLKDAMLAAVYLRVFFDRLSGRLDGAAIPIKVPLVLFACIVLIQTLNPNVESLDQAIIGLRTWLYYVPLYFVAQQMFAEPGRLRPFLTFMLLAGILISAIGFHQYLLGPAAYTSLGPAFAQSTFITSAPFSNSIVFRPNATFAWTSHFALFTALEVLLCMGLLFVTRGVHRILLWAALSVFVAAVILSGQRTFFVFLPLLALVLVLVSSRRLSGTIPVVGSGLLAVWLVFIAGLTGPFDWLTGFLGTGGDVIGVRGATYWAHWSRALDSSIIGLGTGATAVGARHVADQIPLFVEVSFAKVVGDLSLLGLAVYLFLFGSLIWSTFRVHRQLLVAGPNLTAGFVVATLAWQLLVFYTGYDLAIAAIPFWFLSGAVEGCRALAIERPHVVAPSPPAIPAQRAVWPVPGLAPTRKEWA